MDYVLDNILQLTSLKCGYW